jgi:hypothetical protein
MDKVIYVILITGEWGGGHGEGSKEWFAKVLEQGYLSEAQAESAAKYYCDKSGNPDYEIVKVNV